MNTGVPLGMYLLDGETLSFTLVEVGRRTLDAQSKLCNVALEMIIPWNGTGSNNATGVIAPVRPT
jgi:hypothetical protein